MKWLAFFAALGAAAACGLPLSSAAFIGLMLPAFALALRGPGRRWR